MKRILFAIPIPYAVEWGFWTRDSGLIVLALRKMGYDARLVGLGDPAAPDDGWPSIRATMENLRDPAWWKTQHPDAVVLSTWSAPRHDGIRLAALAATPWVVERTDTDGIRSARLFPKPFFIRALGEMDLLPPGRRWLAYPRAVGRTVLQYLFPSLVEIPMARTMKQLPGAIIESPIATERMQQMMETYAGSRLHAVTIPHPVNEEVLRYNGAVKENRLITVGRWQSFQKDYPMLRRVLRDFLLRYPNWQAVVVGKGVPARDIGRSEDWESRITYHENLDHEALVCEYSRAKIYLMVSRYESFCIAAAEALCCGCSVVGSSDVATSSYFAGIDSGTVAPVRTPAAFGKALDHEIAAWAGNRHPERISQEWLARVGADVVARETLAFLEGLPGSAK